MSADVVLFFALLFVAIAIAGATAFAIFWPLTLVHVRDRHPAIAARLGAGAFLKPEALGWLLRGGYREVTDPARISLLVILLGLTLAGLLWLVSIVFAT
jgi:hypothetical protein